MSTYSVLVPTPYNNPYYRDIPRDDLVKEFNDKLWEYGQVTEVNDPSTEKTVELSIEADDLRELSGTLNELMDELESMYQGEDYSSLLK